MQCGAVEFCGEMPPNADLKILLPMPSLQEIESLSPSM